MGSSRAGASTSYKAISSIFPQNFLCSNCCHTISLIKFRISNQSSFVELPIITYPKKKKKRNLRRGKPIRHYLCSHRLWSALFLSLSPPPPFSFNRPLPPFPLPHLCSTLLVFLPFFFVNSSIFQGLFPQRPLWYVLSVSLPLPKSLEFQPNNHSD